MTTILTLITDRPSLSLWTRLPGTDAAAWSLSCPRCRRVFTVTDEQPVSLHSRRPRRSSKGQEITVRGEIICPHGCGAQFSVQRGQVQWRTSSEHCVA